MATVQVPDLETKVRQVRRRQFLQTLLWHLPSCLAGALVVAALFIILQRSFDLPIDQLNWPIVLAGLTALALAVGAALAVSRRASVMDSALALDEAFNLQERVTTAIGLSEEQKRSSAGQALLEDVQQQVTQLDAASRFPLRLPRNAVLVPVAAIALVLLVLFYPERSAATAGPATETEQAKKETVPPIDMNPLKEGNKRRREIAKELSPKFQEIQADLDNITRFDKSDKEADLQQAVQETTEIAAKIKKRQEELGATKEIQQQLKEHQEQLKKEEEGPAKDAQQALGEGDFTKAQEQLNQLAGDLKDDKLSEEQKKELEKQLNNLKDQLKDIADQKERKENLANSSSDPETKKREEEQIKQDEQKLKDLKDLSQKLGECQQCLNQKDSAKAAEKLKEASAQLEQMQKDQKESEQLKQAMQDVDKLKQCLG